MGMGAPHPNLCKILACVATDQHRTDDNIVPINQVAHFTNIPTISNGKNTQTSLTKSAVDDVSSKLDPTTDVMAQL
jgi:hypothetical protein